METPGLLRSQCGVSQRALTKCKLYEPHPGETKPELTRAVEEAATPLQFE